MGQYYKVFLERLGTSVSMLTNQKKFLEPKYFIESAKQIPSQSGIDPVLLNPSDFSGGSKMMESIGYFGTFISVYYMSMLYKNPCIITVFGDYTDENENFPREIREYIESLDDTLFDFENAKNSASNFIDALIAHEEQGNPTIVLNLTTREYFFLKQHYQDTISNAYGPINPISILCSSNTGSGGSYSGTNEQDETKWALSTIMIIDLKTALDDIDDFTNVFSKIEPKFIEKESKNTSETKSYLQFLEIVKKNIKSYKKYY